MEPKILKILQILAGKSQNNKVKWNFIDNKYNKFVTKVNDIDYFLYKAAGETYNISAVKLNTETLFTINLQSNWSNPELNSMFVAYKDIFEKLQRKFSGFDDKLDSALDDIERL